MNGIMPFAFIFILPFLVFEHVEDCIKNSFDFGILSCFIALVFGFQINYMRREAKMILHVGLLYSFVIWKKISDEFVLRFVFSQI